METRTLKKRASGRQFRLLTRNTRGMTPQKEDRIRGTAKDTGKLKGFLYFHA
jgi:hypothetical protein